jgi:DHHW protein
MEKSAQASGVHYPHASGWARILHALLIFLLLTSLGVIFLAQYEARQVVSETENRRLAAWPALTQESLLDGSFARGIESYVADHFPLREHFTQIASFVRANRGLTLDGRVVQVKGGDTGFEDINNWAKPQTEAEQDQSPKEVGADTEIALITPGLDRESNASPELLERAEGATGTEKSDALSAQETPPQVEAVSQPTTTEVASARESAPSNVTTQAAPQPKPEPKPKAVEPVPSVAIPTPPAASSNKPLNVVGGVLLHEGQALFMFGGTDKAAQGYANAVNTWVDQVAKPNNMQSVSVVVTPTSSHFYLPAAARARTTSEARNLEAMKSALNPEVRFADVIAEMQDHTSEPMFFKSDHHWTGLGAYYAYRAWAQVMGLTPLELSAFDKRSVAGVAGSFWSLTQAPELRQADKVSDYYVPTTVTVKSTQYVGPEQKTPAPHEFFAEKSRGYIVFLGGDVPLLVGTTNAGTGRTALVVKNSYGNAFAPYLLPHFDKVVVVDYRYVFRNIQDIVKTFGVTDLVFVNATITANSGAHQERMRQVARGTSTAWQTEAEKRRIRQEEAAAAAAKSNSAPSE